MRATPKTADVDYGIYDQENIAELLELFMRHHVAFTFSYKADDEWGMELTAYARAVIPHTRVVFEAGNEVFFLDHEKFIERYKDRTY